jgi:hypothetical protein
MEAVWKFQKSLQRSSHAQLSNCLADLEDLSWIRIRVATSGQVFCDHAQAGSGSQ